MRVALPPCSPAYHSRRRSPIGQRLSYLAPLPFGMLPYHGDRLPSSVQNHLHAFHGWLPWPNVQLDISCLSHEVKEHFECLPAAQRSITLQWFKVPSLWTSTRSWLLPGTDSNRLLMRNCSRLGIGCFRLFRGREPRASRRADCQLLLLNHKRKCRCTMNFTYPMKKYRAPWRNRTAAHPTVAAALPLLRLSGAWNHRNLTAAMASKH